eukprot:Tamp_26733.p3 GENE.Tamp_26733~~Tamp_26733.p3  ORF type:complete len:128 (-),score=14.81 Tamp_26733:400-783(-)
MLKENVTNMSQAYKDLIMELDILTTVKQYPNLVTFFGACIIDKQQPVVFEELVLGPTLEKFLITRIDSGRRLERRTVYSARCRISMTVQGRGVPRSLREPVHAGGIRHIRRREREREIPSLLCVLAL